jgi:hypothetical protein
MYTLVQEQDANVRYELEASTFDEATEEALKTILQWYIIEDDKFIAVSAADPNDTIELEEHTREDAEYETINKLGYFILESHE